jgi:hypothetical protein
MDIEKLKNNQAQVVEKLQNLILSDQQIMRENIPSFVDVLTKAVETLHGLDKWDHSEPARWSQSEPPKASLPEA